MGLVGQISTEELPSSSKEPISTNIPEPISTNLPEPISTNVPEPSTSAQGRYIFKNDHNCNDYHDDDDVFSIKSGDIHDT
jgi:hypothetical protein